MEVAVRTWSYLARPSLVKVSVLERERDLSARGKGNVLPGHGCAIVVAEIREDFAAGVGLAPESQSHTIDARSSVRTDGTTTRLNGLAPSAHEI